MGTPLRARALSHDPLALGNAVLLSWCDRSEPVRPQGCLTRMVEVHVIGSHDYVGEGHAPRGVESNRRRTTGP